MRITQAKGLGCTRLTERIPIVFLYSPSCQISGLVLGGCDTLLDGIVNPVGGCSVVRGKFVLDIVSRLLAGRIFDKLRAGLS